MTNRQKAKARRTNKAVNEEISKMMTGMLVPQSMAPVGNLFIAVAVFDIITN